MVLFCLYGRDGSLDFMAGVIDNHQKRTLLDGWIPHTVGIILMAVFPFSWIML
jgi:hypothetical protein